MSVKANGYWPPDSDEYINTVESLSLRYGQLTCEELGVRSLGLLDARGSPWVENFGLHDRRLHEEAVLVAGALPRLPVLDLHQQLILAAHPRHVALPILQKMQQITLSLAFSEVWM